MVTESVFSVDGDLDPLARLHEVARRHSALLLVDDAHALGVTGPHGAGAVAEAGLAGEPDVVVTATLSKALGRAGGVVAGPAELIRHLVDTGRTFIYDTALPPAVAAGVLAAVGLARDGDGPRADLADRTGAAVRRLNRAGLVVSAPAGGVASVTVPGPEATVAWATDCLDPGGRGGLLPAAVDAGRPVLAAADRQRGCRPGRLRPGARRDRGVRPRDRPGLAWSDPGDRHRHRRG